MNTGNRKYIRYFNIDTWSAWKELATMDKVPDITNSELTNMNTKLAQLENTVNQIVKKDVPSTVIVSENPNIILNSNCVYEVINGICYVVLWGFQSHIKGQYVICNSMPKTKITMQGICCYGSSGNTGASIFAINDGINNGKLFAEINIIDEPLYGSFSYPVAE